MLSGSSKNINITPPIGFILSGFLEREHGSVGILNDLFANILVLSDEKTKIVLVTMDVIGVDRNFVKNIRDYVSSSTDIPSKSILICASHTHSGPEAARFGDMGKSIYTSEPNHVELSYYDELSNKIANAIIWANNTLEPVKLGFKQSQLVGLGSNRIDSTKYVDNTVTVMKVEKENGEIMTVLSQYACHPTILDFTNFLYSGDYVSFYKETVEQVFGGCVAMFAQGCAGNVSTRHTRKGIGFNEAKRMGLLLAGEVIKDVMLVDTSNNLALGAAVEPLEFAIRDFGSDEDCEKVIRDAELKVKQLKEQNAPESIQRTAFVEFQGATRNYGLKKSINIDKIDSEMQLIKIGDWKIITTPGETFGEIGEAIRRLDPNGHTLVTGYTNGYVGYIPTLETFRNPIGYEIGVTIVSEDSEERIISTAKRLVQ